MKKEVHFVVIVYDISIDKRRRKLHNLLLNYGSPVQYSVFECIVDEETEDQMMKVIHKTVKLKADHVRFYYLCDRCVSNVRVIGGKDVLDRRIKAIVVDGNCEREEG